MGRKYSLDEVREYVSSVGFTLISDKYKDCKTHLEMICSEGHTCSISFDAFTQGNRCKQCHHIRVSSLQRRDVNMMSNYIISKGYTPVDIDKYINNDTMLHLKCSEQHDLYTTFGRFKRGCRCKVCRKDHIIPNKQSKSLKDVVSYVESQGYTMNTDVYLHGKQKLSMVCPQGHGFEMIWNNFQQGQRCPTCFGTGPSRKELEVKSYVESLVNTEVIGSDRTTILNDATGKYLELDIWLPELRKAIEFNGRFWHSFEYAKSKDLYKVQRCKDLGIDLLVIDEDLYDNNLDLCQLKIREFLGV